MSVAGARVTVLQYRYGAAPADLPLHVAQRRRLLRRRRRRRVRPVRRGRGRPRATPRRWRRTRSRRAASSRTCRLSGGSAGEARAALFDPPGRTTARSGSTAGTPLAIFATGAGDAAFRRYSARATPNDAASWGAPVGDRLRGLPAARGRARRASSCCTATSRGRARGAALERVDVRRPGDARRRRRRRAGAPSSRTPPGACTPSGRASTPTAIHLVHAVSDDGAIVGLGDADASRPTTRGPDRGSRPRADHVGVVAWESARPRSASRAVRARRAAAAAAPSRRRPAATRFRVHKTVVRQADQREGARAAEGRAGASSTSPRSTTSRSARRSTPSGPGRARLGALALRRTSRRSSSTTGSSA